MITLPSLMAPSRPSPSSRTMMQKHQDSFFFGGDCAESRAGTNGERADVIGMHPVLAK